jgi:hypothetical protein
MVDYFSVLIDKAFQLIPLGELLGFSDVIYPSLQEGAR